MAELTVNDGSFITLSAGGTLTSAYRSNFSSQPKAYFFGKNKLNALLTESTSVGIRVYFGQDTSGNLTMVLVAADANGNDLCSSYILDNGVACPTVCSNNNALNS